MVRSHRTGCIASQCRAAAPQRCTAPQRIRCVDRCSFQATDSGCVCRLRVSSKERINFLPRGASRCCDAGWWSAGDSTVDAGSYRCRQSSDRRAAAVTRRRLRQAGRGRVLLGTTATPSSLLAQVSQGVVQTDVSTSRSGDSLCTATSAAAAAICIATSRRGLSPIRLFDLYYSPQHRYIYIYI